MESHAPNLRYALGHEGSLVGCEVVMGAHLPLDGLLLKQNHWTLRPLCQDRGHRLIMINLIIYIYGRVLIANISNREAGVLHTSCLGVTARMGGGVRLASLLLVLDEVGFAVLCTVDSGLPLTCLPIITVLRI